MWVVNGFFVFMPFVGVMGETNLPAGGWTAFVGGTLFEIGGYLMVLESLNRKHEVSPLIPYHVLLSTHVYMYSLVCNTYARSVSAKPSAKSVPTTSTRAIGTAQQQHPLTRNPENPFLPTTGGSKNGNGLARDGGRLDFLRV